MTTHDGYMEDATKYKQQIERYNMTFTLGGINHIDDTNMKRVKFNYAGRSHSVIMPTADTNYDMYIKAKIAIINGGQND